MDNSCDQPISLVLGDNRNIKSSSDIVLPSSVAPVGNSHIQSHSLAASKISEQNFDSLPSTLDYCNKNGKAIESHSSYGSEVYRGAEVPTQFGWKQFNECSSQSNRNQHQYSNRTMADFSPFSSMTQARCLDDGKSLRAYDNTSLCDVGQLSLQPYKLHYSSDRNKQIETHDMCSDIDSHRPQDVRHPNRTPELLAKSKPGDMVEKNGLDPECYTRQMLGMQQTPAISASSPLHLVTSPCSSDFPQSDFTKSCPSNTHYEKSSPKLNKNSQNLKIPSSSLTNYPVASEKMEKAIPVCLEKTPAVTENLSTNMQMEKECSSLLKQCASESLELYSITSESLGNGPFCNNNPFSRSIIQCGEVEQDSSITVLGNRNIPKKRVYLDSTDFIGNSKFPKMDLFTPSQHKSRSNNLSEVFNELSPLLCHSTKLKISYTTDKVASTTHLKTNYAELEEISQTAHDLDADRAMKGVDFEGSQEMALRIGGRTVASAGEDTSSTISEEQIREIEQIAARILSRPVSITWKPKYVKLAPELEAKTPIAVDNDRAKNILGKKQCRKKPLSQVIDMLNQESEQVNRELEGELEMDPLDNNVKSEDYDWSITESEPKRKPTRKRPPSLVVRLKREKNKNVQKCSKKTTQTDTFEPKTASLKLDDPDYIIETRSFRLRNKRKCLKIGLKQKEGDNCMCDVCGKSFSAKSTLRLHKLIHNPSRPYVCSECNKAFRHKGNLVKHRQSHTGVRPYICIYCDKGFSSRYALKIHTRKHTGERPFDCTVCEKKFYTKSCLVAHMNIHSGKKNIVCEICGKLFYNQANLYLHMRTHSGERPYICTMCDMSFAQKVNLTNHLRTHTGERPFQCETCGHSYAQLSTLQIHIRTHTGEKPFVCAECGKTYATRGGLRMHKMIHGGIKQFKCTFCDKSFVDKSNLKKHVRIHTGEKPYMCDICGRYFNQSSALRTHWKTHPEIGYGTKKKPYRVLQSDDMQSSLAVTEQQLVKKFSLKQKE